MNKTVIILSILALLAGSCRQTIKSQNMESIKLKESEDGNYLMERIGNSIYVRYYNETRRYMDITPLMSPDEFMRISNRIATIGNKEMVQKRYVDYWCYGHNYPKYITTSRELTPYWGPYHCYDIWIDEYYFM
jgi:hypothetical protein